jgi:nicotinate dehydrogenase subunit B
VSADDRPRRPWDRTPPQEREYFDLLGPGLVSVLPAQREGGGPGGWSPPVGGAWVHIGEDGAIHAFTGKADVGQGTRTALALVVAEVLDVPVERVDLRMGDTDLCPWDMGTFGSRSMPDAAPAVYAAAIGARDALRDLASRRTKARADEFELRDGAVLRNGDATGVAFGELVRGQRLLREANPPGPSALALPVHRIGRPVREPLADEVVTGRRRYGSDLARPGMVFGAVLWPPVRGATLVEADTGGVARFPGVTLVREDAFVGAFASDPSAARTALATVPARWDRPTYPPEADIEAYLRSHPQSGDEWDTDEEEEGDVESGMARALHRLEAKYRTAYIAHVPLEPRCALAEWTGGRLTVWVGTQTPFRARTQVAKSLGISEDDVRVIVPPTGAGFGGKHGGDVAAAAARLARVAGRPVRLAFTREEEFVHGYLRPLSIMDVRAAIGADGRLTAWSFHNLNGGSAATATPYIVPNRHVWNTLTESPLSQGPYRSLAANANNFARESAMDELAAQAGIDPLEFRHRHLDDERLRRVLDRAAARAGWASRVRTPGQGFGMALGREKGGRIATVAEVTVDADRRLRVARLVSAFEAGAIVAPENLRSQVEGAQVMALGGALFEEIHFERGVIQNPRLSQYRVPRFSDLPEIEVELIDAREYPPAGAGETPMIAVAPAIANAIFDATGARLRALPLVPSGRVPAAASSGTRSVGRGDRPNDGP